MPATQIDDLALNPTAIMAKSTHSEVAPSSREQVEGWAVKLKADKSFREHVTFAMSTNT